MWLRIQETSCQIFGVLLWYLSVRGQGGLATAFVHGGRELLDLRKKSPISLHTRCGCTTLHGSTYYKWVTANRKLVSLLLRNATHFWEWFTSGPYVQFLQSKMLHAVWLEKHTTSSSPGAPAGELANYHWGCFGFLHILVGLLLPLLLLLLLSQLSLLGEVLRWALQDTFLLGNYILCALLLFLAVPFKLNQNW